MRYFKVIHFTTGDEYETSEFYIDEPRFRKIQKSILDGAEFLIFEDKLIKRSMLKEIKPAGEEIGEYKKMGISNKTLGLPERPMLEKGDYVEETGFTKIGAHLPSKENKSK